MKILPVAVGSRPAIVLIVAYHLDFRVLGQIVVQYGVLVLNAVTYVVPVLFGKPFVFSALPNFFAVLCECVVRRFSASFHDIQGDTKEAVRYCEDLRTPVRQISQTVWTGDKALDYLISSKMALAGQEQIKTKVNIEYPHNTNIRSVDLTTILGNLLDNALEAAKTAPEGLRFLNLTIRRINAMLIIKVENGYGDTPVQENGKLLTSKKDKAFHGWGLKSVQTAADRYDGTIRTDYKDHVFQSVVTLSFQPVKTA